MAWIKNCVSYLQKHIQVFAGVGLATSVTVSMLPQTVFLSRYRKVLAHTQGDGEMPLDQHTNSLIEKVCQRIGLKAAEEADLQFFTCYGSDPLHKGSLKMKFGAIVGLPAIFTYRNVTDVKRDELLLDQAAIDWESGNGEALLKSLIFSDGAKAFAIAREMYYSSSHHLHVETIMRFACGYLAYFCGYLLNQNFKFNQRLRFWARFSIYSSVACVWFLLYVLLIDTYNCWQDNSVDRKAAELSKFYAQGGLEYYTKLLERNQALRALMGSDGPKKFTTYGNVVSTWRRDHSQLTTRQNNLRLYLQKYENL